VSSPPAKTPHAPGQRRGFDWSLFIVAVLSVGSAGWVLHRDGWAEFVSVFEDDAILFLELVPKVVAGTLIGALVRLMVPRDVVVRWLGAGSGLRGLVIAAIAGLLIPAGPFTMFPLAAAFLTAGADAGAMVTFITAWLLLGLNRVIIWELPFFGPAFVAVRFASCFWVPVAAGLAARHLEGLAWFRPDEEPGSP
jgi:uncharacterized membrane protein YraQ (UPF0718 family)